jgi:site-specific recombinase XerD
LNLLELWKAYETDKRIQGFSPHTLKAYVLQLNLLMRDIGNPKLEEISLSTLKEYLAIHSEHLKPSSLGHRMRFIRSLFRYAFEEGYINYNPASKLKEPKSEYRTASSRFSGAIATTILFLDMSKPTYFLIILIVTNSFCL